ncbi:MAG: polysaccharide biosynthesis tyrosine autokinase [Anaerolineae bacterium]|nr:MAG: polysaccharide biosynthesis tyrosine autokinase [Anaerolineae bacterium]
MELKEFLDFLRRWVWLLILGTVLGGAVAFAISSYQTAEYQSSTEVMVMQPRESLSTDLISLTDIELAETLRSLLVTRPVLEAASQRIGSTVNKGQVSSRLIDGTQLMLVTVNDSDPERAPQIANALVEALIQQNDDIQSSRFAASEESLQAQIAQVERQIETLRAQENQPVPVPDEDLEAQRQELESSILEMNNQAIQLEAEINALTPNLVSDPLPLSPRQREKINEKQAKIVLLELSLENATRQYQEIAPWASEEQLQNQADEVTTIINEISGLNDEISAINKTTSKQLLQLDDKSVDRLNTARAELALLRLNLDIANGRYGDLVRSLDGGAGSESAQTSQNNANLALYQQIYSSLLGNYEAVRLARLQSTPNIVQVEKAIPPGAQVQPRPIRSGFLGAVVGLLIAAAVAFLVEYLDDTLKTPDDISNELGLPIVGYVVSTSELDWGERDKPREKGPYLVNHPRSPLGEAFRFLRTNLEYASLDKPLTSILVTSPGPSEGKTTIAANLAAAFSQQKKRVVLLDCDLRRPKLHQIFQIPNSSGLCDLLLGEVDPDKPPLKYNGSIEVIPSGTLPSNPVELLGSEKMTRFLDILGRWADVVIIDSPPSIVSDAFVLAAKVDGVLLLVQPSQTRADAAKGLMEQLHRANARVVGVILNKIPQKRAGYYGRYRYSYQYSYYHYSEDAQSSNGQQPGNSRRSKNPIKRLAQSFLKK